MFKQIQPMINRFHFNSLYVSVDFVVELLSQCGPVVLTVGVTVHGHLEDFGVLK